MSCFSKKLFRFKVLVPQRFAATKTLQTKETLHAAQQQQQQLVKEEKVLNCADCEEFRRIFLLECYKQQKIIRAIELTTSFVGFAAFYICIKKFGL